MKALGPTVNEPTKEQIVKLVNANPAISVKELAEKIGIQNTSNIHYHIRRLEKAGRIHWQGTLFNRGRNLPSALQKRWEKGLVKLPRHTREEEEALIEKVVRKAHGRLDQLRIRPADHTGTHPERVDPFEECQE